MLVQHIEFLVEESSAEAFLRALLPRILPASCTFDVHPFQGKDDLLKKLRARLRGYATWLPDTWRIVVLIDRDDDDCVQLKRTLDDIIEDAGLRRRGQVASELWQVVGRLAIEELEAWYFADWAAVCAAYPRVATRIPAQSAYRDPDAIRGGTWEAFERVLKHHGYFTTGLRKIETARTIGALIDPTANRSASFRKFMETIQHLIV